jgi:hypothetical protein
MREPFDPALLRRDYGDIRQEVRACRERAALFDFSLMHCARVCRPSAGRLVQADTRRGARLRDASGAFHDLREADLPFFDPGKHRPRRTWAADFSARMSSFV